MTNSLDDVGEKRNKKNGDQNARCRERERERWHRCIVNVSTGRIRRNAVADRFVTRPQNPIKHWIMIFTCGDIQEEEMENRPRNESLGPRSLVARTIAAPPLTKYCEIGRNGDEWRWIGRGSNFIFSLYFWKFYSPECCKCVIVYLLRRIKTSLLLLCVIWK